jgi:ribonucrease Y
MSWDILIAALTGASAGALLFRHFLPNIEDMEAFKTLQQEMELQLKTSEDTIQTDYKEREKELRSTLKEAEKQRKTDLKQRENKLLQRDQQIDQRDQQINRRDRDLNHKEKDLNRKDKQLEQQEQNLQKKLLEVEQLLEERASLSLEEARNQIIQKVEKQAKLDSVEQIRKIEDSAKELAEEHSRLLIAQAIQRYAGEHVAEHSIVTVAIREDQTGKIIGKEGRNIRAFSQASGCDLLIDDTPGSVIISCFNPLRREIAKRALERLLLDGRINQARIEDAILKTENEVDSLTRQYGEQAALELEISGLHPELLKYLGCLYFTRSFAQNVLQHSVEVGVIAGLLANELGLNPKSARRAGLLHDIGKAADQLVDGDHAEAGAALCKKYGESALIVNAVASHHDDDLQAHLISQLISAANTLSTNRPGARRATLAAQIKRVDILEELAMEMDEVESCFAFKAGQELRVVVDNAKVDDAGATILARELSKKIEDELSYHQDIKVVVVRPTRVVSYAR